jgi:hypothetical protein
MTREDIVWRHVRDVEAEVGLGQLDQTLRCLSAMRALDEFTAQDVRELGFSYGLVNEVKRWAIAEGYIIKDGKTDSGADEFKFYS